MIPFKAKAEGVFVRLTTKQYDARCILEDGKTGDACTLFVKSNPRGASKRKTIPGFRKDEAILFGFTASLTESQWAEVVEMDEINSFYYNGDERVLGEPFYMDYSPKEFTHPVYRYDDFTATESGHSLMRSLGITEGNWIVILKR